MSVDITLINKLLAAQNIMVLTGAGISKESGLSTFRDSDGYWAQYDPTKLASLDGFLADPLLVWKWYYERKQKAIAANPNAGHLSLVEMERLFKNFHLFTQNVDNLHRRAGSVNLYELHGNIFHSHCLNCGIKYNDDFVITDKVPICDICGGMIRPSVVWFGEQLPSDILKVAFEYANKCDVFFTIGTSSEVYPAAQLPFIAKDKGAFIIEINPNPTSFSPTADLSIRNPASEALTEIIHLYKQVRGI